MTRTTDTERAAMVAALIPLGDVVAERGLATPLADYTREQILALIETVVTAYQSYLYAETERLAAQDRAFFQSKVGDEFVDDEIPFN